MSCRQGNGEAAARELASACGRPLALQHGVKPTQLFSRNAEVDAVNSAVRPCDQGLAAVNGYMSV